VLLGREANRGRIFGWDIEIWRFLHVHQEGARGSMLDRAVNVLVEMGGDIATLLLGLLILSILLRKRRVRDAFFLVITTACIVALTPLFKEEFVRTGMKYSFPSGHAARSATVVAAAVVIAWPTRYRWLAVGLGSVFTATLGTALVYEDWHLPSDVLGGWCLGVACVAAGRAALYGPLSTGRARGRGRLRTLGDGRRSRAEAAN
jgi:undecaprenyl-diphosphatase